MVKRFSPHALAACFFSVLFASSAHTGFFDFFKKKKQVVTVPLVQEAPVKEKDTKESEEGKKVKVKTLAEEIQERCELYADDLVRLAYHEAAHLVLCIEYNRPVSSAVIYPEKLDEIKNNERAKEEHICLGQVVHTLGIGRVDKYIMIDEITIECAGCVVEMLYFKDKPVYADDDMLRVSNWVADTLKRWDAQGKKRKYSVKEKIDPVAIEELKNFCMQRAKTVLTAQEGLLTAFADGLLSLNLLNPTDIAKIIAQ